MRPPRWLGPAILFCALPAAVWAVGAAPAGGGGGEPATRTDWLLLFAYVFLALFFSFLCSVAESVLLSITPTYIEGLKQERPRRAALLKRLKQDDIDQSLAAILTLNTIAHTVGAIGAGAKATVVFGSAWFGLFSAVMTLMILFLSEIVPKTIGAVYWARIVTPTALFVSALIKLLYPVVRLAELLTRIVARGNPPHAFSRDELASIADLGEQHGYIRDNESRIVRNLLRFQALKVDDIMTPRPVIAALEEAQTVGEVVDQASEGAFSRLPLYNDNLENVTGFVLKEDLLRMQAYDRTETPLAELRREIPAVVASLSLTGLLERFLEERQHVAVVRDEYGSVVGLVTLEDLVETLIGLEITDETDTVEDMRAFARKRWEERVRRQGLSDERGTGGGAAEKPAVPENRAAGQSASE